jgi:hypothetical protein
MPFDSKPRELAPWAFALNITCRHAKALERLVSLHVQYIAAHAQKGAAVWRFKSPGS